MESIILTVGECLRKFLKEYILAPQLGNNSTLKNISSGPVVNGNSLAT